MSKRDKVSLNQHLFSSSTHFQIWLIYVSELNPKLPDFMMPKQKKPAARSDTTDADEPVAGTSTGGHTVPKVSLESESV